MGEIELLVAEASTLAGEMLSEVASARTAASRDDAKEAIQRVIQLGEEMRDRLEEAMDFAGSEDEEATIDDALNQLEDALDAGHLALSSDDQSVYLEDVRLKLEQIGAELSAPVDDEE